MATVKKNVPAPAPAPVVDTNPLAKLFALTSQVSALKAEIANLEDQLEECQAEVNQLMDECGEDLKASITELSNIVNPQTRLEKVRRTRVPGKVLPDVVEELQSLFADEDDTVDLTDAERKEIAAKFKCDPKDVTASMESIAVRQKRESGIGLTTLFKLKD
jgi:chromosome segregation ATPase